MYTSAIKKLLFADDKHHYSQHFPHMVLPLIGPDTDLPALAQVLAQDGTCGKKGTVAAVITWIIANKPEELTAFCQAYGQPAKVYDAIRDWYLPETISKHFRIHELVHEAINPDAKLCKDPRVGSIGLQKAMLLKAPISQPESAGRYGWYGDYEYGSEEAAVDSLREYLAGKQFEVFFTATDSSYNEWVDEHYTVTDVGGYNKNGKAKQRRERKKTPPSRKGVILADIDIRIVTGTDKDGYPVERDRHLKIVAGDEPNEWVAKLYTSTSRGMQYAPPATGSTGKLVATIGTFTAAKIVNPTNYKQVIAEVTKLPVAPAATPQVDAGSLAPIQDRARNEESVAKDETLPKEV